MLLESQIYIHYQAFKVYMITVLSTYCIHILYRFVYKPDKLYHSQGDGEIKAECTGQLVIVLYQVPSGGSF